MRWRSWPHENDLEAATAARQRPCRALPGWDSPSTVAPPNTKPYSEILKLLPKSCSNLKNSQNMKSLEFQTLQVSCLKLSQIQTRFWNLNWKSKGDTLLKFGNLEITLNFILKLQKLKIPKLYT
jgi:hypothetical protein